MINIKLQLVKVRLDAGAYTDALKKKLQIQMRQAAREFVLAAIVKVPIDTGQARGTFLPLGRFLKVTIPISGAQPTGLGGATEKSQRTGAGLLRQKLFQFESETGAEIFEIDPQLFYFWFNDMEANGFAGTPWKSLEEGKKAFLRYMRDVAPKRLPRIKDFVKFTKETREFGG